MSLHPEIHGLRSQELGLVWFGMVWLGLVSYGMVWFGLVWYGLVWVRLGYTLNFTGTWGGGKTWK